VDHSARLAVLSVTFSVEKLRESIEQRKERKKKESKAEVIN